MTRREFNNLKEGDTVVLNGLCRCNAGIKCRVTNVVRDENPHYCVIWVETLDGAKTLSVFGMIDNWNEISYKAANLIKES